MHIQKNESGQAAIEFILVFIFAGGITFLFINQALNMTVGYLVHYANFMASRTYLVADNGSNTLQSSYMFAQREATKVFKSYNVENFGAKAIFEVLHPVPIGSTPHVYSGTTALFAKSLSSMPVVGSREKANFYSESFLGKEPVRIDCLQMTCKAVLGTRDCDGAVSKTDFTLYDNGC